jgi:hypothetical protein
LVARALQDRDIGDDAPAAGELIVDADVKQKLVIFDLIVIDGALRLLIGANEVAEGIFMRMDVDYLSSTSMIWPGVMPKLPRL